MGKRQVLIDDYDGAELPEDTSPVRVQVGDAAYDLYLSDTSRVALDEALADFISDAEPADDAPAPKKRAASADPEAKRAQRDAIKQWVKGQNKKGKGFKVPGDQGRIAAEILDAYYAANREQPRHH